MRPLSPLVHVLAGHGVAIGIRIVPERPQVGGHGEVNVLAVAGHPGVEGRRGQGLYPSIHLNILHNSDCTGRRIRDIKARPISGGVVIQWQNPGVPSNTKYQRQIQEGIRFETGRDDWTDIAGTGASTTLYELQGLANGRTYGVLLRAVAGSQTWCFEKLVFVTPYNPNLSKPTGLTAARVPNTSGQVRLTWNGTATDYDVQYQGRVGPSVSWTSLSTATGAIPKLSAFAQASGKTSVTVSRLPCGGWNEYDFRVREKSGTSIGPNSDVIGNIVPGRWGTAGDDTMNASGNVGACFYGLGGNDTLRGGGGNDILAGQDGIDTLNQSQGEMRSSLSPGRGLG